MTHFAGPRTPDFVVAGYSRSGTTWLHSVLRSHPDIFLSERKELHFFDRNLSRGIAFYDSYLSDASPMQLAGDITPTYAEMPDPGALVSSLLPDTKVVVILRNPLERLVSIHRQLVRDGRHQGSLARLLSDAGELNEYGAKQLYAPTIRSVNDSFAPDRRHIVIHDQLRESPSRFLDELLGFLGLDLSRLDPSRAESEVRANPTITPRFPRLHRVAQRSNRSLRRRHLASFDRIADWARSAYETRFTRPGGESRTEEETDLIMKLYLDDVREAGALIGHDLEKQWAGG